MTTDAGQRLWLKCPGGYDWTCGVVLPGKLAKYDSSVARLSDHPRCPRRYVNVAECRVPAPAEATPEGKLFPHYTSTYCLHGLHESCRLTCKHCLEQCRCRCHEETLE